MGESFKETRDQKVTEELINLYNKAVNEKYIIDESLYGEKLDQLFNSSTWGYREILLVVVMGFKIDSSYIPSEGFYKISPRAVYEGPIRKFLIKHEIPHRKSGPLNIAKATKGLDNNWSAQRRESNLAQNVVKIVETLEKNSHFIDDFGVSLIRRFLNAANKIEELYVESTTTSNPVILTELACELIKKIPDSGNTPQKVTGFLLKNFHNTINSNIFVTGYEDRASVTSTTSKKPGDLNEEFDDGQILNVYEVTVKPFNMQRIVDSFDTIRIYNENNTLDIDEIIVLCRKSDVPKEINRSTLNGYLGHYNYKNITYYFIDIFEWIAFVLHQTPNFGRHNFYNDLNNYINEYNTNENVKIIWKELLEGLKDH